MSQMSETTKRIFTAIVLIPIVFYLLIYFGTSGALILSGVCSFFLVLEFGTMHFSLPLIRRLYFTLSTAIILLGIALRLFFPGIDFGSQALSCLIFAFLFWPFALLLALSRSMRNSEMSLVVLESILTGGIFGFLYSAILPMFLVSVCELTNGRELLFAALIMIWSGDSGAYFGGRAFGKRPILVIVSPKKSWEGLFFGSIAAAFSGGAAFSLLFPDANWVTGTVLGFLFFNLGQVGDFTESLIKRAHNVKDSGQFLPGHGGFMDRLDSLLFVLPVVYIILKVKFV